MSDEMMREFARAVVAEGQEYANGIFVAVLMAERHPDWWDGLRAEFRAITAGDGLFRGTVEEMEAAADAVAETFPWS